MYYKNVSIQCVYKNVSIQYDNKITFVRILEVIEFSKKESITLCF